MPAGTISDSPQDPTPEHGLNLAIHDATDDLPSDLNDGAFAAPAPTARAPLPPGSSELDMTADIVQHVYETLASPTACRPQEGGGPSPMAEALIDAFSAHPGAICEMHLSAFDWETRTAMVPDAKWYRAVFRMPDGTTVGIHDSGADFSDNPEHVMRYGNGEFVGVVDPNDPGGIEILLNQAAARVPHAPRADVIRSLQVQFIRGATTTRLGGPQGPEILAQDRRGNYMLLTERGIEVVSGTAPGARHVLDHLETQRHYWIDVLGIPEDEVNAEFGPLRQFFEGIRVAYEGQETQQPVPPPFPMAPR